MRGDYINWCIDSASGRFIDATQTGGLDTMAQQQDFYNCDRSWQDELKFGVLALMMIVGFYVSLFTLSKMYKILRYENRDIGQCAFDPFVSNEPFICLISWGYLLIHVMFLHLWDLIILLWVVLWVRCAACHHHLLLLHLWWIPDLPVIHTSLSSITSSHPPIAPKMIHRHLTANKMSTCTDVQKMIVCLSLCERGIKLNEMLVVVCWRK